MYQKVPKGAIKYQKTNMVKTMNNHLTLHLWEGNFDRGHCQVTKRTKMYQKVFKMYQNVSKNQNVSKSIKKVIKNIKKHQKVLKSIKTCTAASGARDRREQNLRGGGGRGRGGRARRRGRAQGAGAWPPRLAPPGARFFKYFLVLFNTFWYFLVLFGTF